MPTIIVIWVLDELAPTPSQNFIFRFRLGELHYAAGEVRQAVESFEQCLQLRRRLKDKVPILPEC